MGPGQFFKAENSEPFYSHLCNKQADLLREQGGLIQKVIDTYLDRKIVKQAGWKMFPKIVKQAGSLKWRILSQPTKIGSGKNKKSLFFLLGLKITLRTCFESNNISSNSCPELSNQVLSFSEGQIY